MEWEARYNDGSSLPQFNPDGSENKYIDIDRSRLVSFVLYHNNKFVFELHLDPGQRLIFRRRVEQVLGGRKLVVYLVGWQQTIHGQNIQSIAYVLENGEVHLAGAWKDNHPWFYSVDQIGPELDGS